MCAASCHTRTFSDRADRVRGEPPRRVQLGLTRALQAEFTGTERVPDTTQTAKPAMEPRIVKDN